MFRLGCKYVPRLNVIKQFSRRDASKLIAEIEDPIVVTDDGSTIVCWHPEKMFPYQCTKPMPELLNRQQTVLKTTKQEAMKLMSKKRPDKEIVDEMAQLTHTTFHKWYPRSRDKKAKKTPKDREFL